MKPLALTGITVLTLGLALPASAQEPDIVLKCGGIGIEESSSMLQAQSAHSLTILFSTEQGGYVSDVRTRIETTRSPAVATNDQCGPVAQVDVAQPGEYRIRAELDGVVREQTVRLAPRGGTRIVLRWPD
ncbi:MAG: hypothetical protein LPJ87_11800 [Zoogloeaceae bacterium]|nr:hypothetical protein [Zoogloeaceae bacterium]